jgi:hypothetical protein
MQRRRRRKLASRPREEQAAVHAIAVTGSPHPARSKIDSGIVIPRRFRSGCVARGEAQREIVASGHVGRPLDILTVHSFPPD